MNICRLIKNKDIDCLVNDVNEALGTLGRLIYMKPISFINNEMVIEISFNEEESNTDKLKYELIFTDDIDNMELLVNHSIKKNYKKYYTVKFQRSLKYKKTKNNQLYFVEIVYQKNLSDIE